MQINDSLNLVVPLRSDDKGPTVHGYHVPISREVFEANFRVIAATRAALASKGLQYMLGSGPQIAALTLRDEAKKDAVANGYVDDDGKPSTAAADGLLLEIKRLTTVMAQGATGWGVLPVDTAITQGLIDADDWREAESAIVFFTVHSSMSRKRELHAIAASTASVLKGSITSSTPMDFCASLPTSTPSATTAPKVASSVPS